MTKKTTVESIDEVFTPTDADMERAMAREAFYVRDTAMGYAMTYHKNNGGMLPIAQVVEHANVFLTFLKGETK